jgi:hypothetical protein
LTNTNRASFKQKKKRHILEIKQTSKARSKVAKSNKQWNHHGGFGDGQMSAKSEGVAALMKASIFWSFSKFGGGGSGGGRIIERGSPCLACGGQRRSPLEADKMETVDDVVGRVIVKWGGIRLRCDGSGVVMEKHGLGRKGRGRGCSEPYGRGRQITEIWAENMLSLEREGLPSL